MNISAVAWLIIRLLGLVSGSISLYQLYDFVMNIIAIVVSSNQPPVNGSLRLINLHWDPLLGFMFFSMTAVYFLKFGERIHKLLIKGGGDSDNS